MDKSLSITLLVTVIAITVLTYLHSTRNQEEVSLPTQNNNTNNLPVEFISGNSRFSQGSCATDEDCIISGCSQEVCGNKESITTCEFSEDFPNKEKYNCGCVNNVCGWSN